MSEHFLAISIAGLILIVLTFLHVWAFQAVYKNWLQSESGFVAMERGVVAGAVANYFVSVLLAVFINPYYILLFFLGLPFAIAIGVIFTCLFWWINKKLELKAGFWGRAILGLMIGSLIGIVIGWLLVDNCGKFFFDCSQGNESAIRQGKWIYFVFFSLTAVASAIMTCEGAKIELDGKL